MNAIRHFIGIDIASADFVVSVGTSPWKLLGTSDPFANSLEGFQDCIAWLQSQGVVAERSVICLEATGVYGEAWVHYLAAQGYPVAVEPPLKVRRAFAPQGHKNDPVDSQQIAEYAYRFVDELHLWHPPDEVLEQLKVLLTTREQLVNQRIAHRNQLHALRRKVVRTPLAEQAHEHLIGQLQDQIQAIEQEIRRLIDQQPPFEHLLGLLLSVPGIGLLLAAHLIILIHSQEQPAQAKKMAAYLGICPYEYRSGTSIYRPPTSRHYGPEPPRKLLHLAARSVCTHNERFRLYYQRKLSEGKPKKLALNNVANKLLKIACAVVNSQVPFDPLYSAVRSTA
jgi:transposase